MGKHVKSIEGVHAVTAPAMLFIIPMGGGRVLPAIGATILDLGGGRYLATAFNGARRFREVLELRDLNGTPTLGVAPN